MKTLGIIPARMASTRFPGKPLAKINGRPMLEWTWRAAAGAKRLDAVIVATEDNRIYTAAREFGAVVVMTSTGCQSGTERCVQAAKSYALTAWPAEIILNIQADEPLIRTGTIDQLVEAMTDPSIEMATVVIPGNNSPAFHDKNRVKVVTDRAGFALYFSRMAIPSGRPGHMNFLQHVGIYGFRAGMMHRLIFGFERGPLEDREGLEQLRALENGIRIKTIRANYPMMAVDSPDDVRAVSALLAMAEKQPSGRTRE